MRENNKKKPLPVIEQVHVIDASSDGQAVGRVDDVVVFIKNAVPGDVVDVQITRKKNKFREGKAIHTQQYSNKRTPA
jgi:23S rRNA (uracil1939-C5)-methyltransferase